MPFGDSLSGTLSCTTISQPANLTWNNTPNTLSATNFIGSGGRKIIKKKEVPFMFEFATMARAHLPLDVIYTMSFIRDLPRIHSK